MVLPEEGFTDISFGGEVRSGPSNLEKRIVDFPSLFKDRIQIFDTLFNTYNPKIYPVYDICQEMIPFLRQSDTFAIDTLSGRKSPLSPYKGVPFRDSTWGTKSKYDQQLVNQ